MFTSIDLFKDIYDQYEHLYIEMIVKHSTLIMCKRLSKYILCILIVSSAELGIAGNRNLELSGTELILQPKEIDFFLLDPKNYIYRNYYNELMDFIINLSREQDENRINQEFLREIYRAVSYTYLVNYKQYSSLTDVLLYKEYDCLSGTALFAIIFETIGFEYQIIRQNYHIYVKVMIDTNEVLIETTDPKNGFITKKELIKKRERSYSVDKGDLKNMGYLDIQRTILSLRQLAGLQWYNLAVYYNNTQHFGMARYFINKALHYHISPELLSFMNYLATL
jgi:hypothetical protein